MRKRRIALPVAGLLLLAGLSSARQDEQPAGASAEASAVVPQTPAEQFRRAESFVTSMRAAGQSIERNLEQARAARDVVKVLCLNDKLNQVEVAVRSAEGRLEALGQAADRNDGAKARHDFAVLEVLNERTATLVAEASQCVGEEIGFFGEGDVSIKVDPEIPETEADVFGSDVSIIASTPVLSSPVL